MGAKVKLFNVNDGLTGRTGGPYLDEVQAQEAEIRRAAIEGREPEEGAQPYAGMQLVPAATLLQQVNVNNTPSEDGKFNLAEAVDEAKFTSSPVTEAVLDESTDEGTSGSADNSETETSGRRAARN